MQIIKCTKKLQKEMGLKKSDLSVSEPVEGVIGPWHANLIYILGKKCVIFVNDKTLFNFIVAGVTRDQIRNLSSMFIKNLSCTLADEGINEDSCRRIIEEHDSLEYKITDNKSVLGSMNDLAFHYKVNIEDKGSIHTHEIPNIIKRLNHMPMGALKYAYAIDALKEALEHKV